VAATGAASATRPRESVRTLANLVTCVRTVLGITFGVIALAQGSLAWLVGAYLTYWAGDILDGVIARRRDEETIIGAVFDVVCDRACTTVAAGAFVAIEPSVAPAVAVFLIQFCMIDTLLTLSFLYLPGLISPNYFYRLDAPTYRWNWSPAAKAANTSVVVLLCLAGLIWSPAWIWAATIWALAMTVLKVSFTRRVLAILDGTRRAEPRPAGARVSPLFG
jgi:CDP-diacylglycerol--glycerol-3-phosphate 3-phosphatidyltransferase